MLTNIMNYSLAFVRRSEKQDNCSVCASGATTTIVWLDTRCHARCPAVSSVEKHDEEDEGNCPRDGRVHPEGGGTSVRVSSSRLSQSQAGSTDDQTEKENGDENSSKDKLGVAEHYGDFYLYT